MRNSVADAMGGNFQVQESMNLCQQTRLQSSKFVVNMSIYIYIMMSFFEGFLQLVDLQCICIFQYI